MDMLLEPDYALPEIPQEIFSLAGDEPDLSYHTTCAELWAEILTEVCDPEYRSRSHHNVGTYDVGCRGPLCRKALREHPKRRSPSGVLVQVRDDRVYDPVLEYYHTILKYRIRKYQQLILKEIAQ